MTAASHARPASPCIGVCRLDDASGWCVGCGRSGEEIGSWRDASAADQDAVLRVLPDRLAALDRLAEPLAVDHGTLLDSLRTRLAEGAGAIVLGCHGAVAEFATPPGDTPQVAVAGETLTAAVPGGRLRLVVDSAVRAFATRTPKGRAPVLLAMPRERADLPVSVGLTPLGADGAAGRLFDLGLGRPETRFMVRTADAGLTGRLESMAGAPVERLLAELGPALVEANPARIVETPVGRCEVTAAIPPPGGSSPQGPHTHLLPGPLALGRMLPPGIACPPGMTPVALHYPPAAAPAV